MNRDVKLLNYKETLLADRRANCFRNSLKDSVLMFSSHFSFLKHLRRAEYYFSKKSNLFYGLLFIIAFRRYKKSAIKYGYSIPLNVAQGGLALPHYGTIVIHPQAKIGKNCMIQAGVNIGMREGDTKLPIIGDNVYLGPGAKIFGSITIADNCYIGANSVVNKSIEEKGSVIVGAPAKVVRQESLTWWQKNKLELK